MHILSENYTPTQIKIAHRNESYKKGKATCQKEKNQ